MAYKVEKEIAGKVISLETGRVAKQADGAVVVQCGDTVVLATAVASKEKKQVTDFLLLTVDYQEKYYASGKIPGGFFRREGRPGERETLVSRLIDRSLRPLFPQDFPSEIQVIASVLSADMENSPDFLGLIGASAALTISDVPFNGPVGAVRVGRINGQFLINPGFSEAGKSDLDLVVAGTADAVMMVEGEGREVPEEVLLDAIELAHKEMQPLIEIQKEMARSVGKEKRVLVQVERDPAVWEGTRAVVLHPLREAVLIPNKTARQERLDAILQVTLQGIGEGNEEREKAIRLAFFELEREEVRRMILEKGIRADGRGPSHIRPITCEVGVLPRTHGSALFTRGETQSLAVVTLGTSEDEQKIDALEGEWTKAFMLHYNFPPFSVGEARPLRGPGRREIGHGALAERALKPVIPGKEEFPYTLRIVSDILESNGSSSMATVCGGTLALMDAGVPIKSPVAGIAMGLIKEGDKTIVISDILGLEDHLGDMDFKVTGTAEGITAIQMDIKIAGITKEVMRQALEQAKVGRMYILNRMLEAIPSSRPSISLYAPRIIMIHVKQDKIREVIGPGGRTVRGIIEKTGVKIDIEDDGTISIASPDETAAREAVELINKLTEEVEVGKIYLGKVKRIMDFGAFVEILPKTEGLVHISQLAPFRVKSVTDVLSVGDEVMVKVLEVDREGKIRLSRKEALKGVQETPEKKSE